MANYKEPFLPHGGYRKLRSYKVAEVVYDATVVFCRRLEKQGAAFLESGEFSENLYRQRGRQRGQSTSATSPDECEQPPECPLCGSPMRKRTARKGPRMGLDFWGCSGYPECKATLPIKQSNGMSDKSDASDKNDN